MRDRICIILLNCEQTGHTLATLSSVAKIDYKHFTTVVVVQKSTSESVLAIRTAFPRVPLFENSGNSGAAAGNNEAIAWALKKPFKWILLLDNSAQVPSDFLKKFTAVALSQSEVKLFKTTNGAAYFIHRSVFETIGLFDPQFFLFWDKADFCSRARRKGFARATVEIANFHSAKGARLKRNPKQHYNWWHSYALFAQRNYPSSIGNHLLRAKLYRLLRSYFSLLIAFAPKDKAHRHCLKSSILGITSHLFIKFLINK